jgi:hypothetical protein
MLRIWKYTLLVPVLSSISSANVTIESVAVFPTSTITPDDSVSLEIAVFSTSSPAFLYQPTSVEFVAHEVFVNLFVDAGDGDALDWLSESAALGRLEPGIYPFTVTLWPGANTTGGGVVSGNFTVIPEPATLALLTLGILTVMKRRRWRQGQAKPSQASTWTLTMRG